MPWSPAITFWSIVGQASRQTACPIGPSTIDRSNFCLGCCATSAIPLTFAFLCVGVRPSHGNGATVNRVSEPRALDRGWSNDQMQPQQLACQRYWRIEQFLKDLLRSRPNAFVKDARD